MLRSPHARVRSGSCNCTPDSFGCVSPLDEREQTPSAAGEGPGSSCRRSALAGDPVGESNSSSGYNLRRLPSRSSTPSSFGAVSPMDERPAYTPTAAGIVLRAQCQEGPTSNECAPTPARECAECESDGGADGASNGLTSPIGKACRAADAASSARRKACLGAEGDTPTPSAVPSPVPSALNAPPASNPMDMLAVNAWYSKRVRSPYDGKVRSVMEVADAQAATVVDLGDASVGDEALSQECAVLAAIERQQQQEEEEEAAAEEEARGGPGFCGSFFEDMDDEAWVISTEAEDGGEDARGVHRAPPSEGPEEMSEPQVTAGVAAASPNIALVTPHPQARSHNLSGSQLVALHLERHASGTSRSSGGSATTMVQSCGGSASAMVPTCGGSVAVMSTPAAGSVQARQTRHFGMASGSGFNDFGCACRLAKERGALSCIERFGKEHFRRWHAETCEAAMPPSPGSHPDSHSGSYPDSYPGSCCA
jgi:hypothetical protein